MKRLGVIVLTAALAVCLTACGGISKSVDLKYGETYKIEDEKLAGKENLTWESEFPRKGESVYQGRRKGYWYIHL